MKTLVMASMMMWVLFATVGVHAHSLYVKNNPTNETGIVFGVDEVPSEFVRWRAYVRFSDGICQHGENTMWEHDGIWCWYDLNSVDERVLFRISGFENRTFIVHYWLFREDGTWAYGPQNAVVSDQIPPTATIDAKIVYNQDSEAPEIAIHAHAQDTASDIEFIRVYMWTPEPYLSIAGWTNSDNNQLYQDFFSEAVEYAFEPPVPGIYTFTTWVKDTAGNIAQEPGGRDSVKAEWGMDPPEPIPDIPPNAPSHVEAQVIDDFIRVQWQDMSDNEQGFYVYRNGIQYVTTVSTSFDDKRISYETEYCYDVASFNDHGQVLSQEPSCAVVPAPDPPEPEDPMYPDNGWYAHSFTYPVNVDFVYGFDTGSWTKGYCYDMQPFGSIFHDPNKVHMGSDINCTWGDYDEPVLAVGDCIVSAFDDIAEPDATGKWIILHCTAPPDNPFFLNDGTEISQVAFAYLHLAEIRIITDTGDELLAHDIIPKQTRVKKGWQIGTIGNANGYYMGSAHLHIQMQTTFFDSLNTAYVPLPEYGFLYHYADPIEFIDNNQTLEHNRRVKIVVHSYDRRSDRNVFLGLDDSAWKQQGRKYSDTVKSVGYNNNIWLVDSTVDSPATWRFKVPYDGRWSVSVIIPRFYADASEVMYWFEQVDGHHLGDFTISQHRSDSNRKVYLGTYELYADHFYQLGILSETYARSTEKVVIDAIEVLYQPDNNTGGAGLSNSIDSDDDGLPDEWEQRYGLDPSMSEDAYTDIDGDGLDALTEYFLDTDPTSVDSDGDGIEDAVEIQYSLNPNDPLDASSDCDGDGISNEQEITDHTDPCEYSLEQEPIIDSMDIQSDGSITLTYSGIFSHPQLYCMGNGFVWGEPVFPQGETHVHVSYVPEGTMVCNIELEPDVWMAQANGYIYENEHLFVNGIDVVSTRDNGQGGSNLVFTVVHSIPEHDTDTNEDNDSETEFHEYPVISDNTVNIGEAHFGGCTMQSVNNTSMNWLSIIVNLLLILGPILVIRIVLST